MVKIERQRGQEGDPCVSGISRCDIDFVDLNLVARYMGNLEKDGEKSYYLFICKLQFLLSRGYVAHLRVPAEFLGFSRYLRKSLGHNLYINKSN